MKLTNEKLAEIRKEAFLGDDREVTALLDAIEKMRGALDRILIKNPNAVSVNEAADMAIEFHMGAHSAWFELFGPRD